MAEQTPTTGLRVLQVAGSSSGGVRHHIRELSAGLALEHRVLLAAPAAVARPWLPGVRSKLVDIADRPRPQDGAIIATLRQLGRNADVVHAHGLRAGALAALGLAGQSTPLVVTLHNLPVGGPTIQAMAAGLERLIAAKASTVLTVSGDLADQLRGMGARDVERALIPATVRLSPAIPRDQLGLDAVQPLVVTVARLAPQKGIDLLIDVAGLLADRVPHVQWLVAGDGPLRGDLERAIEGEQLPVRLLGHHDDVPGLLAAADVVVSTASWEGQPVWLQEAMHAGAAVVATDVGGTREVTGAAARLVPSGSADALVTQIASVLRERSVAQGLRSAALERAHELPRPHDALAQVNRIYSTVLT